MENFRPRNDAEEFPINADSARNECGVVAAEEDAGVVDIVLDEMANVEMKRQAAPASRGAVLRPS